MQITNIFLDSWTADLFNKAIFWSMQILKNSKISEDSSYTEFLEGIIPAVFNMC